MKRIARIKVVIILLIFSIVCFTPLACEPLIEFKLKNQTQMNLKLFYGDTFLGDVGPGESLNFKTLLYTHTVFPIIAKNATWNVVYAINITRNDIQGEKTFEVVIPSSSVK